MKAPPEAVAVARRLRDVFNLDPGEVLLLVQDVAETLDTVCKDLLTSLDTDQWVEFQSAAQALVWLADNVDVPELKELAAAAFKAAETKDKTFKPSIDKLQSFSAALRAEFI